MKLADISNGPDWVVWAGFIVILIFTIILLSGRGAWLIAGYNTASKEEKAEYDEKKLCRVTGIGMAVIAILILVMGLFEDMLPASFAFISLGIIIVDCIVTIVVSNTVCKK